MVPISNRPSSSVSGNEGRVGDEALQALIPFSGALSPDQVRSRMVGPILNGPPAAIWRRTTIQHTNADGVFSLYACERTGQAMWVPVGDFFVADKPQGAQPTGSVMDYLLSQRRHSARPEGYGIVHTGRTSSGQNGNIHQPRGNHASMLHRPERAGATRLHRFNPLVRQEPAPAGTGSRRTVARRERREKVRTLRPNPPSPPPPTATSTSVADGANGQGAGNGNSVPSTEAGQGVATTTPPPPTLPSMTIYNSAINTDAQTDGNSTFHIYTLNLSDNDDDD